MTRYQILRKLLLPVSCLVIADCFVVHSAPLAGQEPGWTSRVLKVGEDRVVSEQTPILERPYRPLHFYGNAVRRNYYRGNPWPMPRDLLITSAFLLPSSRERELEQQQRWGTGEDLLMRPDPATADQPAALAFESGEERAANKGNEEGLNQERLWGGEDEAGLGSELEPLAAGQTPLASGESSRFGQGRPSDSQTRRSRRGRQ